MALGLKIKQTEIAGNSLTIDDDTQNYTVNNLTGYGTPNPDRTDLKLFLRVFHVDKDGVEAVITPETYNTALVTSWTLSAVKDGRKKYYIIGIDISSTVPSDIDVNAYLDAIVAGAGLGSLTNGSVVNIAGTNYTLYITASEELPIPQARMDKVEAWEVIEGLRDCDSCEEQIKDAEAFYNLLKGLIVSAVYNFDKGNKTRAQTTIEKANETGEKLYEES